MSDRYVNLDRFQSEESPAGREVGSCYACGGVMYEYEAVECDDCGNIVHNDCLKDCEICGHTACKKCMKQDKDTLDYFCSEDREEE